MNERIGDKQILKTVKIKNLPLKLLA